ncbi:MAG TPA: class I SAM-dependent methyltransferase [Candidatus Acidoferrum sp.]|nr:class I SAM-dependent methyltransferase [Candidatus Acidoferrum sp.]
MNYTDQLKYLARSRALSAACALCVCVVAALSAIAAAPISLSILICSIIIVAALAGSLWYTPDYLHLSVNPDKCLRWQVRIRWRLAAAVLLIGLPITFNRRGMFVVLASFAWLLITNFVAKSAARPSSIPAYFLATDFALLAGLVFTARINLFLGVALLAAAIHVSIVASEKRLLLWTTVAAALGAFMVLDAASLQSATSSVSISAVGLTTISAFATALLVSNSLRQNELNVDAATREIIGFTACSPDRVRELWATSNQQLAKNWQAASLPEDDRERLAAWYAENSELYLFAISAYNLEYRRIRTNLRVLRYARGACLDYGAGNGEIILEVARRGLPATYYDVDGVTMRFAMDRARQYGFAVQFAHTKEELAAAAKKRGFDTVFAFDVLEHIPDLPGELDFLSSLLAPGGLFVFDVPAGATKSHPMHLNHNLNVDAHLQAKGLRDARTFWQRSPLGEKGRFIYRRIS